MLRDNLDSLFFENDKVRRILIVDDDRDYIRVISTILKEIGYDVATAESGEEAIKKATENPPNLMLCDVLMIGGMGGIWTLEIVKKFFPETKVIMVSALRDKDIMKKAFESGASGYITKPFDFGDLENIISTKIALLAT